MTEKGTLWNLRSRIVVMILFSLLFLVLACQQSPRTATPAAPKLDVSTPSTVQTAVIISTPTAASTITPMFSFTLMNVNEEPCTDTYYDVRITHDPEWGCPVGAYYPCPQVYHYVKACSSCTRVGGLTFPIPYGGNEQLYYDHLMKNSSTCVCTGFSNWVCKPGEIRLCGDGQGTQLCEQQVCGADWGECRKAKIDDPASCEERVGNPVNVTTGEVTYQPSRPDIEISTAKGSLTLMRAYSSLRAFDDYLQEGVSGNYTMLPVRSWGTGWYHQYEHILFTGENQTDGTFFVYREPDGSRVVFDDQLKSNSHPSLILSRSGEENYSLRLDDGSKLEFTRADLFSSDQPTPVYHLSHVTEPSGRTIALQYYGATETPPCKSVEFSGRLCLITSDDGAFIRFSAYLKPSNTSPVIYRDVVNYGRYTMADDGQRQFTDSRYYTYYNYETKRRQGTTGRHDQLVLQRVDFDVLDDSGRLHMFDRETYEYTNSSYYRPDLGSVDIRGTASPNPFLSRQSILARDGLDVWLLKAVRGQNGEFISGHEYDKSGRAGASIRSGEFLRIAYFELGPGKQITLVVNESKNDQAAEYESINGDLVKIVGDCGCSLGKTEDFERDDDSYTVAKREQDPNLQDSSPGTRTTFTYDDKKRVTIQLDNWEGMPPTSTVTLTDVLTATTALSNPTRVRTFEYADSISSIPRVESRFFSVLCPYATRFGESCPSSHSEPRTERTFDSTGTRISTETEHGLSFDPGTGLVAELDRTYTITYVPNSSLIDTTTGPNNQATRYVYYLNLNEDDDDDPCTGSPPKPNNLEQVKEVWLNDYLIERRGAYNEKGLVGCVIDENGVKTSFVYDHVGRVLERKTEYDTQTRLATFTYRSDGQLFSSTKGTVYHESDYYTGTPELASPTSPDFCNTQSNHNLTAAEIAALQQKCIAGLGYLGQVVRDESGTKSQSGILFPAVTSQPIYGPTGQLVLSSLSDVSGEIMRQTGYAYDPSGNLWQQYKYIDQLADPGNLSGSASFTKQFTYDTLSQVRFTQDERFDEPNRETRYDALGRIESITAGLGTSEVATTTYEYDTNDNIVKVVDPDGRITEFLYDDFGQLSIARAPDTGLTKYLYDLGGNLVRIKYTDGTTKTLEYDDRNRLKAERFERNGTSAVHLYYYDWPRIYDQCPARPPVEQTPAPTDGSTRPPVQQTPAPTGDDTRPPINQNPAETEVEVSQSFVAGRLASVQHDAGWTHYSYTAFGEVEAVYESTRDQSDPCQWRITRYQYDDSGRLTTVTYPSGRVVRYVYDPEDLYPSRIELLVSDGQGGITTSVLFDNMSYDVDGNLAGYTAGQVTLSAQWDLAGQATQRHYEGTAGHDFDWMISSRDGNGNIEAVGDASTDKSLALTYDGQDRLQSAIGTNLRGYQDCSYVYDASGNRLSEACDDTEITYSYEELSSGAKTNRLGAISWSAPISQTGQTVTVTQGFAYDETGRATNGYTDKYPSDSERYGITYDLAGHLQTVDVNLDGLADYSYFYDHRNLRTLKTGPTGKTHYTYDLSGRLLSVQEPAELREYIWLNDQPIAMLAENGNTVPPTLRTYILGLDHLGTPMRAWSWDTGEMDWAVDYEAFGQTYEYIPQGPETPELEVDLRLPGQVYDYDSRLYYNWHRWYDPATGRYLQADPVEYGDGKDIYIYVSNSPVNLIDPQGLQSDEGLRAELKRLCKYWKNPRNKNLEQCGLICKKNASVVGLGSGPVYETTGPFEGVVVGKDGEQHCNQWQKECSDCCSPVAAWHTHPPGGISNLVFSDDDRRAARGIDVYLFTESGAVYVYKTGATVPQTPFGLPIDIDCSK